MYRPSYRTNNSGVPILKKEEIDSIAERFILEFCPEALKEPQEIDIDSFVMNYLKLKQDFQYLSHCGVYLGMIVFNDTNKVIVYNQNQNRAEYIAAKEGTVIIDNTLLEEDQEHRYRFTMGHEGGHWIFHRDVLQHNLNQMSLFAPQTKPIIKCRAANIEGKVKPVSEWTDDDRMEWQSNYMSSALMMPKSMILAMYNDSELRRNIEEKTDSNDFFSQEFFIDAVSRVFNVSIQAAEIRLKNLGIINEKNTAQDSFFNGRGLNNLIKNIAII